MPSIRRPAWLTFAHFVRLLGTAIVFTVVCGLALLAGIYGYAIYLALKLWVWP